MRTRDEIQASLIRRAGEIAGVENYGGPGRFSLRHYKLAVRELPVHERDLYAGLAPPPASTPEETGPTCSAPSWRRG